MGIKKGDINRKNRIILLIALSLMILTGLIGSITPNVSSLGQNNDTDNLLHSSSYEHLLIDKVYTFTVSNPILTFDSNIELEKSYYYYISVKIVTPHECDVLISIIDPEGDRYDITHEKDMVQDDSRKIPYGVTITGNHTFIFEAILAENLNVYIKIEKGDEVLQDRISPDDNIIYNNITKFKSGNAFEFRLFLRTDRYYKFIIERVSTISLSLEHSRVSMNHVVWDPSQILFKIFENLTLSYMEYYFGTAIEGIYTFDIIILIESDVECVNVAFGVIEKGQISIIIDPNDPDPDPHPPEDDPVIDDGDGDVIINGTQNTQSELEYSIPQEATITLIAVIGIPIAGLVAIVIYHKKKNVSSI